MSSGIPSAQWLGPQQYLDGNGNPLAGGFVSFSGDNPTWEDGFQNKENPSTLILDSEGRGVVFGAGIYQQTIKDGFGNQISEQNLSVLTPAGINAAWFGIRADGVTDDTVAWGKLISLIQSTSGKLGVVFVGGVSLVSASLEIVCNDLALGFVCLARLTISGFGSGDGLAIRLENGSVFECSGLGIAKPVSDSFSGTGFTITADVAAGPQQPIKKLSGLEIVGSWSTGALIDVSCVVLDNFYANLANNAGYAPIGLYWGNSTNYQTNLTLNSPLINNASKGFACSALTQGLVVNGGEIFDGDYGAYLDGTGGSLEGFTFNGTYTSTTTRGFFVNGNSQFIAFNGCTSLAFNSNSLVGNYYAYEIDSGYENTITAPIVVNSAMANSGFLKLSSAPLNNATGGNITGSTIGAVLVDNASYRNGISGQSGEGDTGTMIGAVQSGNTLVSVFQLIGSIDIPSVLHCGIGRNISGTGIPSGTTISSVNESTYQIALSSAPTNTGTVTLSTTIPPTFIDASATLNATLPLSIDYNGTIFVTPQILGNTIGLYPNGTANLGDGNSAADLFNIIGAVEFQSGASNSGFQGLFFGGSSGAIRWIGTNGSTVQAGFSVAGGTNNSVNSSTITTNGLLAVPQGISGTLTIGGLLTANNGFQAGNITVNGTASFTSSVTINGTLNETSSLAVGGLLTAGNGLTVNGAANCTGGLTAAGAIVLSSITTTPGAAGSGIIYKNSGGTLIVS